MRQGSHLLEREVDLGPELAQQLLGASRVWPQELPGQLEPDPECDQGLLCAVMEIPFDSLPLPVRTRHDPRTGFPELTQRGAELGAEALVFERLQDRGARNVEEGRSVLEGCVVDERDGASVGGWDLGHAAHVVVRYELGRPGLCVEPAVWPIPVLVEDLEGRIDCIGQQGRWLAHAERGWM